MVRQTNSYKTHSELIVTTTATLYIPHPRTENPLYCNIKQ